MLLPIRSLSRSAISAQATTTSRSPALARMQLDQNGDANSWSLGEFLAQDEVRVMMLDPACTKSLTFREFVNGPNTLSKSTAISNSDNWTGAPAAEDDGSLDDIPSSTDAFTAAGPGPSIAASDWLPQLTP